MDMVTQWLSVLPKVFAFENISNMANISVARGLNAFWWKVAALMRPASDS